MDKIVDILVETGLVSGIVASLIVAFKQWWSYRLKRLKTRRDRDFTEGTRAITRVYYTLQKLQKTDEIKSAIIYEISNGGNRPKPGSKMYMSALYIKHDQFIEEKLLLEKYNKTQIDDSVINMCVSVQESDNPYVLDLDINKNQCMLTDNAVDDKINYMEYYGIYVDGIEEKSFIMAIAAAGKKEKFEGKEIRAMINTHRNVIKQEFKMHRESA